MDRRIPAMALAMTALIASMGAAVPSPKQTPSPTPTPSASPTQGDGTLQILTYRGYAEYGGTSPRVNWVGDFEKTTGCRIARLDTVQTADDMATYVDQRSYDVISAGPVLAASMIERRQAQPIDPAKVTGYDDLTKRFRDMTKVSGKVYGVPYLWGFHEFLYDSTKVKDGGLKQVFQSDRVSLKEGPLTIADAALTDGSVDDPFELTKSQLDRAMALLSERKGRTYWKNPLELVKGFATGSLDYAQATPYYRLLLQKAGKPIKAVSARKMTGWLDSWMLGANIPNTDCAYRWLSWMAAPSAQRDAAAWVGLAPANPKACKGRAKQMCDAYGADKPKWLDRVAFAARPPGGCRGSEGECTDYATWSKQWGTLVN
ncbi:extracellular solute-binding protein [Nonomuraea sp. NPDC049129]|uniref:extracellular solute-binding protein n=1 Tax=unclassified Nonomuraea TaxID=2593643 RepID=UPI0033F94AD0